MGDFSSVRNMFSFTAGAPPPPPGLLMRFSFYSFSVFRGDRKLKPIRSKEAEVDLIQRQIMMRYKEEKDAKKEAFRKYLDSSGVLEALTKVLVALYEQNDKPSSALEFIQQKLGGPSVSDYEKLQAELADLQMKYNELCSSHQETCKELEELKNSHNTTSAKETTEGEAPKAL